MNRIKTIALTLTLVIGVHSGWSQTAHHWETIIKADHFWKYIIPASEPDSKWRDPSFDDALWSSGRGGFGYGDNDDMTVLPQGTKCVYLRKSFEITDTSKILNLLLHADYDDAFVAYINGVEIGRGGGLQDINPVYSSAVSYTREAVMYSGGNPEAFMKKKDEWKKFLKVGKNVLCIQLYNDVATSSDLSGLFFLSVGITDESVFFETLPGWFYIPAETGTSGLPIISINTSGAAIPDEPKVAARISVFDKGPGAVNSISDTPALTCRIGIELRGSTSQSFPKKPYGFETRTDLDSNLNVSLLGLPAENDWVLYAPYNDKTFLRDILAYRLGALMGNYTPRFAPCELFLNGSYQGVYILMERIKQGTNRVNIAKLTPLDNSGKDLSGGYIFKIDKTSGSNNDGWTSAYHPKQLPDKYINFIYHEPRPDVITVQQKSYIKYFVGQFETTLASTNYTDDIMGYRKFIDLNSFVDYFIINEISKNVDGYRISSFFHKDREDRGNKIVAGPLWDYNLAFGNANYYEGASTSGWVITSIPNSDNWQVPFWWLRFLDDPVFYRTLRERYTSFRQNVLKTENIHAWIDSMAIVFEEPQVRNYQKWPVLGTYLWPNPYIGSTYQQEVDYMKRWIRDRLAWMDGNLLILSNESNTGIISSSVAVVYPNPFSTHVFTEIFSDNSSRNARIELYDLTGRLLYSADIPISGTEKTLYTLPESRTESLHPGIYLLRIRMDSGKEFQAKIVKK